MLADAHIHSYFSGDSQADLDALCRSALAHGIGEITITDHDDRSWPRDRISFCILDFDAYFRAIEEVRERYQGRLSVRIGLEIGLNHSRMPEYKTLLRNYPFDFIIGSAHEVRGHLVQQAHFYIGRSRESVYRLYYDNLRSFVERYDCFDVVGHMNLLRRYEIAHGGSMKSEAAPQARDALLKAIVQADKGLEVNSSGYYLKPSEPMPGPDSLRRYRELGGQCITLGSDGHRPEDVGFGIAKSHQLLTQLGFRHYDRFHQRRALKTPLSPISARKPE